MSLVLQVLAFLATLGIVVMLVRAVFDWIQMFARSWRPRGAALVAANVTYGVTDPPLRALRRVIPPLRFGGLSLDLGFLIVVVVLGLLRTVLLMLAMGM